MGAVLRDQVFRARSAGQDDFLVMPVFGGLPVRPRFPLVSFPCRNDVAAGRFDGDGDHLPEEDGPEGGPSLWEELCDVITFIHTINPYHGSSRAGGVCSKSVP